MAKSKKTLQPDACWTPEDLEIMIDCLLELTDDGKSSQNGFKASVWTEVAKRLEGNERPGTGIKNAGICARKFSKVRSGFDTGQNPSD